MNTYLIFTLEDLSRLFWRIRYKLRFLAVFTFILALAWLGMRPPRYVAEASFKLAGTKTPENPELSSLLQLMRAEEDPSSLCATLYADTLLTRTVQNLGLQAEVKHPLSFLRHLKENFLREAGFKNSSPLSFSFQDLLYEVEEEIDFYLRCPTFESVQLLNKHKEEIASAKKGEPLFFPAGSFCLQEIPPTAKLGKLYKLTVRPLKEVLKETKKALSIHSSPLSKKVLLLSYTHPVREKASLFLNTHMASYQNFLKEENEEIARAHLSYLQERKHQLQTQLEELLSSHATYLKEHLGERGFIALEQEVELLSAPKQLYTSKLLDVNVELSRLAQEASPSLEHHTFFGLDLATARSLCVSYNNDLDKLQAEIKKLSYLQEELNEEGFKLSALSSVLNDPLTQELVHKAGALELQLKDDTTTTTREHERVQEALFTQKKFLSSRLLQTLELKKIEQSLLEEKLLQLQKTVIDLLKKEKQVIQENLKEFSLQMKDLPEKWRLEHKLQLETDLTQGMMEGLSQVAEAKNLSHHLFQVESKPLDYAKTALLPSYPFLLLFSLLTSLTCAFGLYLFYALKSVFKGFPISSESLNLSGRLSLNCALKFEELCLQDVDTLRTLAHAQKKGQITTLFLGKSPFYIPNLAYILNQENKKALFIDVDFTSIPLKEETPGTGHFLSGEVRELPLRHFTTYDFIPAGLIAPFATPFFQGDHFASLLEKTKDYDAVFLLTRRSLTSPETESLLQWTHLGVVSVEDESVENVALFTTWTRQKEKLNVSFVQLEPRVYA